MASPKSAPTSVMGKYYASGGRSHLGNATNKGRGRAAVFVAQRRGR